MVTRHTAILQDGKPMATGNAALVTRPLAAITGATVQYCHWPHRTDSPELKFDKSSAAVASMRGQRGTRGGY